MAASPYKKFALMMGLSFIAMYIFMFAMVHTFSDFFNNINQFYMAGLMAAPMAIAEILLMGKMYPHKRLNAVIVCVSIAFMAIFWEGIREQKAVGDTQFIRSMIPHHSGAILMCEQANLHDDELHSLCERIIRGQQDEIDQMRNILHRLSAAN